MCEGASPPQVNRESGGWHRNRLAVSFARRPRGSAIVTDSFDVTWSAVNFPFVAGRSGLGLDLQRRSGVTEKEQLGKFGWEKRRKSRKLVAVGTAHQMAGPGGDWPQCAAYAISLGLS